MRIYHVLALSVLITLSATALVLSGDSPETSSAANPVSKHDRQSAGKADPMSDRCKAAMEMHEKMQSEMHAMDVDLDGLLAEMNGSTGDKKIEVMVAVINRLVQQHKAMHQRMADMQKQMKQNMMQGMTKPVPDSAASKNSTPSTEEKHVHQH